MSDEYSIEEMIDELAELKALVAQPGWKRLIKYGQEAVNRESIAVFSPSKSSDELVGKEYPKGMIVGINSLLAIPETKIEELEAMIEHVKEGREDGDEEDEED